VPHIVVDAVRYPGARIGHGEDGHGRADPNPLVNRSCHLH
jgi:hypothetical protein